MMFELAITLCGGLFGVLWNRFWVGSRSRSVRLGFLVWSGRGCGKVLGLGFLPTFVCFGVGFIYRGVRLRVSNIYGIIKEND